MKAGLIFIVIALAIGGLVLWGALTHDLSDRPADAYISIQDLAAALEAKGLCDRFVLDKRPLPYRFGECRPDGFDPGSSDLMLLAHFADDLVLKRSERWDSTGCNGLMIYGPNWNVGPLSDGEGEAVLNAVGGRVVGAAETIEC